MLRLLLLSPSLAIEIAIAIAIGCRAGILYRHLSWLGFFRLGLPIRFYPPFLGWGLD